MRRNLAAAVCTALCALAIGAFLPAAASACTVTPATSPDVRLIIPDTLQRSLEVFPISDHFRSWDKDVAEPHHLFWAGDGAWAPVVLSSHRRLFVYAVTPSGPTPTIPEPSTLALLGLGVVTLGFAFRSHHFKPAAAAR